MMKTHVRWVEPLVFELARLGVDCHVPPPSRAQMRRYYELDSKRPQEPTPCELDQLRSQALAILCEGTDVPLDQLNAIEEGELLFAIVAAHHQHDPGDAIALHRLTLSKKKLLAEILCASSDSSTAKPSSSPQS